MAKTKGGERALESLDETLMRAAYARNGYVLAPYPKDADPDEIAAAVLRLIEKGLVHSGGIERNLTMAGIEAARKLTA